MKVICQNNRVDLMSAALRADHKKCDNSLELILGKEYIVYSIGFFNGQSFFLVSLDDDYSSSRWFETELFRVIDDRFSRFWILPTGEKKNDSSYISFPEGAKEENFFWNLFEDEERESNIFAKYKLLIDLEFPDSNVTNFAEIGDENWLLCPHCIDAWEEPSALNAIVICPKCQIKYNNPRYKFF